MLVYSAASSSRQNPHGDLIFTVRGVWILSYVTVLHDVGGDNIMSQITWNLSDGTFHPRDLLTSALPRIRYVNVHQFKETLVTAALSLGFDCHSPNTLHQL